MGPVSTTVAGVASSKAPLAGTVTLKDSSVPPREVSARLDDSGAFVVDVRGLTPPFVLKAAAADPSRARALHTVASGEAAANINPITDAAVTGAARVEAEALFAQADATLTRDVAEKLPDVSAKLTAALAPLLEKYGVQDPLAGNPAAEGEAMRALLQDVDIGVTSGVVVVTNADTSAVIFQGLSNDPASGVFVADAMPVEPVQLPVDAPAGPAEPPPVEPTPSEPPQVEPPAPAEPPIIAEPPSTPILYPAITRMVKEPQPALSEPALGATKSFSDLGTVVTRVSDGRHHYAKNAVWNADESLAILNDGSVLDGTTYKLLRKIPLPNEHKTWSNTDPRYVYGANKAQRQWVRVDATTGASTVLATYSQYTSVSYGSYEGNMDNADTGAVLIGNGTTPFLVNPKTGALRCTVKSGGGFGNSVSDATMSQDGEWVLVNWLGYGIDAYRASDCSFARKLTARNSHYDACVSTAGDQVVVQPGNSPALVMTRISDAKPTTVYTDSAMRLHLSCRNTKRPGWVYVSHENVTCDSTLTGMDSYRRIWATKLDGSQDVEIYAWDHQACPTSYTNNPMAVPSRLGNRVWFKAVWDGSSSGLHSFVAQRR